MTTVPFIAFREALFNHYDAFLKNSAKPSNHVINILYDDYVKNPARYDYLDLPQPPEPSYTAKYKKEDLSIGSELIEKQPDDYTEKKQEIIILRLLNSYVYYKTKENTFYPARNSTPNKPLYLDGVIGIITLSDLKKEFLLRVN